jgi:Ser-tRNA(Ala) deacylase AlaX
MTNSYLKEFEAQVVEVTENQIVLDQTAFYPRGGGLPDDTGYIIRGSDSFRVIRTRKEEDRVLHAISSGGLRVGDRVIGKIDWDKRYAVMQMHTGMHSLASMFNRVTGALITGNQVDIDKSRLDVNIEKIDRPLIDKVFFETNKELAVDRDVKIYSLPREEALKIPGVIKLAEETHPNIKNLRIVEIVGLDLQADGGPHVSNTREVGQLLLTGVENKGKANRRVYFTLKRLYHDLHNTSIVTNLH